MSLVALGVATWYFGVKRPDDIEAAALAKQRTANSFTIPGLNADMVWIAPGSFLMGTPEQNVLVKWFYAAREKLTKQPNLGAGEDNERPVTWITLTQPFWLGQTVVTQAQYEKLMGTNPSYFTMAGKDSPVEQVSWNDAIALCQKLTEQERVAGRLPIGYAYTLPTEAQWEYACRGGTTGAYAGDLDTTAWYDKNSGGYTTHPVRMKAPNALGLYDMNGNVCQWCWDWYGDYPGVHVTNPRGPTSGSDRVLRGGGWYSGAVNCRSAARVSSPPDFRYAGIGFRLALNYILAN